MLELYLSQAAGKALLTRILGTQAKASIDFPCPPECSDSIKDHFVGPAGGAAD